MRLRIFPLPVTHDLTTAVAAERFADIAQTMGGTRCGSLMRSRTVSYFFPLSRMKKLLSFLTGVTLALSVASASAASTQMNGAMKMKSGVMVGGALMTPDLNIVQNAMHAKTVTTLVAAVKAAGLVDTLSGPGPFTVFAPTNAAFKKLPKGTVDMLLKPGNKDQLVSILTYHVVPGALKASDLKNGMVLTTVEGATLKVKKSGSSIWINNAKIEIKDVISSNGVTHVINTVLMPPKDNGMMKHSDSMVQKGVMVGGALMTPDLNIVQNAMHAGNVTTLVVAVKAAGLVDTLSGPGPFTVFAPTNDAFAKLPAGTVDSLLKPENKNSLVTVLTYHVVPGAYRSSDLKDGMTLKTVAGETLMINVKSGKVWVNGSAMVQTADVISSNGVTHVIDTV